MLFLSGNRTVCGKFPIINSQHLHCIIITTGGTHHDPNQKLCTNHQHNSYKLDTPGHMLNNHLHHKNNLVQNIQSCDAGEELRSYTNGGYQDYDHTATLKCYILRFSLMRNSSRMYSPLSQWLPSSRSPSVHHCTHPSTYTFTMAQG